MGSQPGQDKVDREEFHIPAFVSCVVVVCEPVFVVRVHVILYRSARPLDASFGVQAPDWT
jgi:hypothetical protein